MDFSDLRNIDEYILSESSFSVVSVDSHAEKSMSHAPAGPNIDVREDSEIWSHIDVQLVRRLRNTNKQMVEFDMHTRLLKLP